MKNNIIIDYFSFVVENPSFDGISGSASSVHEFLVSFCNDYCEPFESYIGGHLYTHGFMSFSGFRSYYGGSNTGNTYFVQISGSGCALLDQYLDGGLFAFFNWLIQFNPKIKRLDLAADEISIDDDGDFFLDPDVIFQHYFNNTVTGSARSISCICPKSFTGKSLSGFTCYVGSRKSEAFMRIYDKRSESMVDVAHWMRCELELKGDKAAEAFKMILTSQLSPDLVRDFYNSVCLNLVRFVDHRASNVTRSKTSEWWSSFLDNVECKYSFSSHREIPTLNSTLAWVDRAVLGSLVTISKTYGYQYLSDSMRKFVEDGRLAPHHVRMINQFNDDLKQFSFLDPLPHQKNDVELL